MYKRINNSFLNISEKLKNEESDSNSNNKISFHQEQMSNFFHQLLENFINGISDELCDDNDVIECIHKTISSNFFDCFISHTKHDKREKKYVFYIDDRLDGSITKMNRLQISFNDGEIKLLENHKIVVNDKIRPYSISIFYEDVNILSNECNIDKYFKRILSLLVVEFINPKNNRKSFSLFRSSRSISKNNLFSSSSSSSPPANYIGNSIDGILDLLDSSYSKKPNVFFYWSDDVSSRLFEIVIRSVFSVGIRTTTTITTAKINRYMKKLFKYIKYDNSGDHWDCRSRFMLCSFVILSVCNLPAPLIIKNLSLISNHRRSLDLLPDGFINLNNMSQNKILKESDKKILTSYNMSNHISRKLASLIIIHFFVECVSILKQSSENEDLFIDEMNKHLNETAFIECCHYDINVKKSLQSKKCSDFMKNHVLNFTDSDNISKILMCAKEGNDNTRPYCICEILSNYVINVNWHIPMNRILFSCYEDNDRTLKTFFSDSGNVNCNDFSIFEKFCHLFTLSINYNMKAFQCRDISLIIEKMLIDKGIVLNRKYNDFCPRLNRRSVDKTLFSIQNKLFKDEVEEIKEKNDIHQRSQTCKDIDILNEFISHKTRYSNNIFKPEKLIHNNRKYKNLSIELNSLTEYPWKYELNRGINFKNRHRTGGRSICIILDTNKYKFKDIDLDVFVFGKILRSVDTRVLDKSENIYFCESDLAADRAVLNNIDDKNHIISRILNSFSFICSVLGMKMDYEYLGDRDEIIHSSSLYNKIEINDTREYLMKMNKGSIETISIKVIRTHKLLNHKRIYIIFPGGACDFVNLCRSLSSCLMLKKTSSGNFFKLSPLSYDLKNLCKFSPSLSINSLAKSICDSVFHGNCDAKNFDQILVKSNFKKKSPYPLKSHNGDFGPLRGLRSRTYEDFQMIRNDFSVSTNSSMTLSMDCLSGLLYHKYSSPLNESDRLTNDRSALFKSTVMKDILYNYAKYVTDGSYKLTISQVSEMILTLLTLPYNSKENLDIARDVRRFDKSNQKSFRQKMCTFCNPLTPNKTNFVNSFLAFLCKDNVSSSKSSTSKNSILVSENIIKKLEEIVNNRKLLSNDLYFSISDNDSGSSSSSSSSSIFNKEIKISKNGDISIKKELYNNIYDIKYTNKINQFNSRAESILKNYNTNRFIWNIYPALLKLINVLKYNKYKMCEEYKYQYQYRSSSSHDKSKSQPHFFLNLYDNKNNGTGGVVGKVDCFNILLSLFSSHSLVSKGILTQSKLMEIFLCMRFIGENYDRDYKEKHLYGIITSENDKNEKVLIENPQKSSFDIKTLRTTCVDDNDIDDHINKSNVFTDMIDLCGDSTIDNESQEDDLFLAIGSGDSGDGTNSDLIMIERPLDLGLGFSIYDSVSYCMLFNLIYCSIYINDFSTTINHNSINKVSVAVDLDRLSSSSSSKETKEIYRGNINFNMMQRDNGCLYVSSRESCKKTKFRSLFIPLFSSSREFNFDQEISSLSSIRSKRLNKKIDNNVLNILDVIISKKSNFKNDFIMNRTQKISSSGNYIKINNDRIIDSFWLSLSDIGILIKKSNTGFKGIGVKYNSKLKLSEEEKVNIKKIDKVISKSSINRNIQNYRERENINHRPLKCTIDSDLRRLIISKHSKIDQHRSWIKK